MLYGKSKRLEKLNPPGGSEKQRFPFMQQLTFNSVRLWKLPRDWSFFAEMGSLVPANTDEEPLTSGSPAVFVRQGEQAGTALDSHGQDLEPMVYAGNWESRGLCTHLRIQFPGPWLTKLVTVETVLKSNFLRSKWCMEVKWELKI